MRSEGDFRQDRLDIETILVAGSVHPPTLDAGAVCVRGVTSGSFGVHLTVLVIGPATRALAGLEHRLCRLAGGALELLRVADEDAALARLADGPVDLMVLDLGVRGRGLATLLRLQALAPGAVIWPVAAGGPLDPTRACARTLRSALEGLRRARSDWRRLVHRATHDALTGLANRWLLEEKLRDAVARAERRGRAGGLVLVDLDGFKAVNDRFGHDLGDLVLETVAARLRRGLRRSDTVARLGGDEFAVVVEEVDTADRLAVVAAKVRRLVEAPVEIDGRVIRVGASCGTALFPDHGRELGELVRRADAGLYAEKRRRALISA